MNSSIMNVGWDHYLFKGVLYIKRFNEQCTFIANDVDPDQTPRSVASDLGLLCLLLFLFRDSSYEWDMSRVTQNEWHNACSKTKGTH